MYFTHNGIENWRGTKKFLKYFLLMFLAMIVILAVITISIIFLEPFNKRFELFVIKNNQSIVESFNYSDDTSSKDTGVDEKISDNDTTGNDSESDEDTEHDNDNDTEIDYVDEKYELYKENPLDLFYSENIYCPINCSAEVPPPKTYENFDNTNDDLVKFWNYESKRVHHFVVKMCERRKEVLKKNQGHDVEKVLIHWGGEHGHPGYSLFFQF